MFERKRYVVDQIDPEFFAAIEQENQRQADHIELIASENYTSPAVMAVQGSQLTNKYAEGYLGKRYYGGCENVDIRLGSPVMTTRGFKEEARQVGNLIADVLDNPHDEANIARVRTQVQALAGRFPVYG